MVLATQKNHYTHVRGERVTFWGNTVINLESQLV